MAKKNVIRETLIKIIGGTGVLILVGLTIGVTIWASITLVRDSLLEYISSYTTVNPYLVIVVAGIIILSVLGYNGRAIIKKVFK